MNKIDELKDAQGCFGEAAIKQVIPYEHPFLMIDKITIGVLVNSMSLT